MIKFTKKQRIFYKKVFSWNWKQFNIVLQISQNLFPQFCIENDPKGQEPLFHCFNLVHSKNNTRFNMGAYNRTYSLECMFKHRSSYVWTILRSEWSFIGAPMYGCRGTLRWSSIWVFFRLPRCQRNGVITRSRLILLTLHE